MNKSGLIKFAGVCLVCLATVLSLRCVLAQEIGAADANRLFYQGNFEYKEAKYEAAIDNYQKALSMGLESGNLYYNLGNSYFKQGELGKAVLNYERALILIPGDSDLKSNYEYVLSLLNLGPQRFGNWLEKAVDKIFADASVNFLTVFLSFIYILGILALISSLIFTTAKHGIKIFLLCLSVLFVVSAISLNSKIAYLTKGAVVISKEAQVKFEPMEGATTYFRLTEGSKAKVLDKTGNWYKIKRPDGKIGWISKEELGVILDPPAR